MEIKHYIIGSRWMKELFPNNPRIQKRCKDTADYDVLVNEEPTKELTKHFKELYGSKTELHYIPTLFRYLKYQNILFNNPRSYQKSLLFTLKASHVAFDSMHKEKTFYDLFLMAEEGCEIIEVIFNELYDFWEQKFGNKWRADFTKESKDFFNDAVSRENIHDELHKSVAYYDQPAFKFLQEPNQTTVWVDPIKFNSVTEHIRQRVVIEEAETLALERFIIPGTITNKVIAYQKMLKALVDRLAPKWMIIYIINNLDYFLKFKEDYNYNTKTHELLGA